jgi:hypothetical protein
VIEHLGKSAKNAEFVVEADKCDRKISCCSLRKGKSTPETEADSFG